MIKIPEAEIRKRLQKLHNYEKILYPGLKERSDRVRKENKELKAENARIKEENQKQLEKILLQLEEIQILKFGKKRGNKKVQATSAPETEGRQEEETEKKKPKKREASSYRRPEPNPRDVTDHLILELENCPECGEEVVDKKEHIHYQEDLRNVEAFIKTAKKIVETRVESGRCQKCNKRQFAMEILKQSAIIGENVRRMVVYQTVIQGLSYEEVRKSMKELYDVKFSKGEVANILEGESRLLMPYYNYLVDELDTEYKGLSSK